MKNEYTVRVERTVETEVRVRTHSVEDAYKIIDSRDTSLPPPDKWGVVKGSYRYVISDDRGRELLDSDEERPDFG